MMITVAMGFTDGSMWTIASVELLCLPFLAAIVHAWWTERAVDWKVVVIPSMLMLVGLSSVREGGS